MTLYHILGSFIAILLLGLMASKLFKLPLMTAQVITSHLTKYFPHFSVDKIEIDQSQRTALVKGKSSASFIAVKMLGDKISCKEFTLSDIDQPNYIGGKFRLTFHDLTYPDLTADFDQTQQQIISSWLSAPDSQRQES